ncbi:MAG TPA: LLM class F420-dependent oxidoreductase, partial [Candidatus Dormibacteraeota bacterium]|nr:LLM class F420-dependent oxidoreductase [Candidatus Dormibacteraeota bacterium]
MKIGFKTSQVNVDWPTLLGTWELADTMEVFDSGWIFDHFVALGDDGGGSHEGMVLAGALAMVTRR